MCSPDTSSSCTSVYIFSSILYPLSPRLFHPLTSCFISLEISYYRFSRGFSSSFRPFRLRVAPTVKLSRFPFILRFKNFIPILIGFFLFSYFSIFLFFLIFDISYISLQISFLESYCSLYVTSFFFSLYLIFFNITNFLFRSLSLVLSIEIWHHFSLSVSLVLSFFSTFPL